MPWTYILAANLASWTCTPRTLCATSSARQRSYVSLLSGRNLKCRSMTLASRSVSATLRPKTVPVEGTGGGVPEFGYCLRRVAEADAPLNQRVQRLNDHWLLRVIPFADAQKDVGVEKTRIALRH